MQVAVDISLYPLDSEFVPPIKDVIARLERHENVEVERNRMSTQVRGDYDVVMPMLVDEIRVSCENLPHAVFAIKIVNNPVN